MSKSARYIPALSSDWLTPVYDPILRWGMREEFFKRELIQRSLIKPGMHVLDLGCGTGTLTIMLKQAHPEAVVTGLDGDLTVLEIAHIKATRAGAEIKLDQGMAFQLPYLDRSFDRVLTCLVMHHLTGEDKQRAFGEIYRVLRTCSELHVLDFGKPRGIYGGLASIFIKRMEQAGDNINGLLPIMMRRAGFEQVEELGCYQTIFGSLSQYRGRKPPS
jgi:ubiquinone/menaquinone biosynthesis C-methylase UbiE